MINQGSESEFNRENPDRFQQSSRKEREDEAVDEHSISQTDTPHSPLAYDQEEFNNNPNQSYQQRELGSLSVPKEQDISPQNQKEFKAEQFRTLPRWAQKEEEKCSPLKRLLSSTGAALGIGALARLATTATLLWPEAAAVVALPVVLFGAPPLTIKAMELGIKATAGITILSTANLLVSTLAGNNPPNLLPTDTTEALFSATLCAGAYGIFLKEWLKKEMKNMNDKDQIELRSPSDTYQVLSDIYQGLGSVGREIFVRATGYSVPISGGYLTHHIVQDLALQLPMPVKAGIIVCGAVTTLSFILTNSIITTVNHDIENEETNTKDEIRSSSE